MLKSGRVRLVPEDLQVSSFSPAGAQPLAFGGINEVGTFTGGGYSDSPDCIVYISDCVSCPPEQETIQF
jgi:hypothetical protein